MFFLVIVMSKSSSAVYLPEISRRFLNRELSWLEFNQRVLGEACRKETPLVERLRFLAITSSNLEEFFMVRVGGLMMQQHANPGKKGIAGYSPEEQLDMIRKRVERLVADQYACLNDLLRELGELGIARLSMNELNEAQLSHLQIQFDDLVWPVCSPIYARNSDDFPAMIGAPLAICFWMHGAGLEQIARRLEQESPGDQDDGFYRYAIVPIGREVQRVYTVPGRDGFVLVEDLIIHFAPAYFPGDVILEACPFHASRNADVNIDVDGAADLLDGILSLVASRYTSDCVRLEIDASASDGMVQFLQSCLEVDDRETYRIEGPIDLSWCSSVINASQYPEHAFPPQPPQPVPGYVRESDIFAWIAEEDRLVVHPYESYDPVLDFVRAASEDPKVIAIKQTLYRTSKESQIISALKQAVEKGKRVTVIVELKARFDEARNIRWKRELERAGVDVIYGLRGLKVHAKMCLVVRREAGGVVRYCHLGTGNYNEVTAKLYTDVSLLTRNPQIGRDVVALFNAITGLSRPMPLEVLSAAPIGLRERFQELIEVEIANARNQRPAMIRAKFNSLVDARIIDKLYEASQAGVKIELNVRGICCLCPGVKGLSDNIRVISIVDRYLEHMRIYHFLHGGDELVFISSADWMDRNLDRRVELLVPVLDRNCANRVLEALSFSLSDNHRAHQLMPDWSWAPVKPDRRKKNVIHSQAQLYELACERARLDQANAALPPPMREKNL